MQMTRSRYIIKDKYFKYIIMKCQEVQQESIKNSVRTALATITIVVGHDCLMLRGAVITPTP